MEISGKISEGEIIEKILQGEKAFYEIIVRRYNPYLYKLGRSFNFDHEDTQDLMQDTYLDAFRSLPQFQQRSAFKTWLIRIMLNNCYRKKQKAAFTGEVYRSVTENVTPMFTHSNNNTAHTREMGRIIENSLSRIPEDYRVVFTLREMNGLNTSETASLLHITESNVKVRLNRAKALLRREIERSYSADDIYEFNLCYCDPFTERVMKKINELC